MKFWICVICLSFLLSCSENSKFDGKWNANWRTSPESFQNVTDISSFEMTGYFDFRGDSVEITANGFPGCIFGIDTIRHAQQWSLKDDSLHLIGENGIRGISYRVLKESSDRIELILMEDIFVDLNRD